MNAKMGLLSAVERGARFALNCYGFQSRTVRTATGTVHAYEGWGPATLPTIVLLHGLGSTATSFGKLLTRIRPHAGRVLALDLPGHGFSEVPHEPLTPGGLFSAVNESLDMLVEEPMVLVGSSLGGGLALKYALDRPERLVGLALVSPVAARMSPTEWEALLSSFKIESTSQARLLLTRLYHRTPWFISALAPDVRDVMRRAAIQDIISTAKLEDLPDPATLRSLAMPVLLLWGQSERLLPPSGLAYFRRYLPPQSVIEEPAGFGHCPHLDDPARLAARLVEFAKTAFASQGAIPPRIDGEVAG
jgi:pimeloyl-ACP methyl ester carboxylesterase